VIGYWSGTNPDRKDKKKADLHDNAYPTIVIEIAYANESLPVLREEIKDWISEETSVMIAIGVKIFERGRIRAS
jgi:hypothetical protein